MLRGGWDGGTFWTWSDGLRGEDLAACAVGAMHDAVWYWMKPDVGAVNSKLWWRRGDFGNEDSWPAAAVVTLRWAANNLEVLLLVAERASPSGWDELVHAARGYCALQRKTK